MLCSRCSHLATSLTTWQTTAKEGKPVRNRSQSYQLVWSGWRKQFLGPGQTPKGNKISRAMNQRIDLQGRTFIFHITFHLCQRHLQCWRKQRHRVWQPAPTQYHPTKQFSLQHRQQNTNDKAPHSGVNLAWSAVGHLCVRAHLPRGKISTRNLIVVHFT